MEIPTLINWASPFPFKELLGSIFHFIHILIEHSVSKQWRQAFKRALLFLFFLLFHTFLICSYFSLLFHENALISLLFHSKMSFTRKNPELFPRSLRSFGFYKLTCMFIQGARRLTPQFLMFSLKVSLFG